MSLLIDFGYANSSASWNDAYLALIFATKGDPREIGQTAGPMAIADASRFVELFEMQVGISPLELGTYAEAFDGDNSITEAVEKAQNARSRGMFPIVIGEDRRITQALCNDPLIALWGKIGRIEADERAIFTNHQTILGGVRAATSNAFQAIPPNVTILTAQTLIQQREIFKEAMASLTDPIHLSIDLDVLAPSVAQTSRSLEPGGLSWYDLMNTIEMIFEGPGVTAIDLVGTSTVSPRSPSALLGSQILLKVAGLLASGLDE